jgi:hypothetical protein
MYPHERSLMEKYADAPFMIVGVNSDDDRERARRVCEEKNLSWPSFYNGGGTDGPISTRWGVRGWPTVYVIDHEGIIRETNARGERLDRAIEEWLPKAIAARQGGNVEGQ